MRPGVRFCDFAFGCGRETSETRTRNLRRTREDVRITPNPSLFGAGPAAVNSTEHRLRDHVRSFTSGIRSRILLSLIR